MTTKKPNPVDVHVGKRIREARILNGLSQTALAEKVGITFQQLQKYESATNRVSCSRLYDLSRVLGVPIQAFFSGVSSEDGNAEGQDRNNRRSVSILDLVENFSRLNTDLRSRVAKVAKSLAESTGEKS
jgi:transcriptional regulator with XRE-family HTH domain